MLFSCVLVVGGGYRLLVLVRFNHGTPLPAPQPWCPRVASESVVDVVAVLIFVVFMLIVAIVYLNLLVAMMTSGYTEVQMRRGQRDKLLARSETLMGLDDSSDEFVLVVASLEVF